MPKSKPKQQRVEEEVAVVVAPPEPPAVKSAVDEVLDLMEQLEEKKQAAIDELLDQQRELQEKLRRLGYSAPAPFRPSGPVVAQPKQPRGTVGNKPCKVCGEYGHDARRHRFEPKPAQPEAPAPAKAEPPV